MSISRRTVVIAVVAMALIAGMVTVFLRGGGSVRLDAGSGPPPASIPPPFPSATPSPLRTLKPATLEPCDLLDTEGMGRVLKADVSSLGGRPCIYADAARSVRLEVEISDSDHYAAFADEAASWPEGAHVLTDPAYALLFVDAERSAAVVDLGSGALVLRLTDARLDARDHRSRMVSLIRLAAAGA